MIIEYENPGSYHIMYIPANLPKGSGYKTIRFVNTETKESFQNTFVDRCSDNPRYYGFEISARGFGKAGEYEYFIENNRGLLKVLPGSAYDTAYKSYYTTDTYKYYDNR